MTRHEIQILRAVGLAQRAVAAKTETSVRRVRRIEREAPVPTGDTAALIETRKVGRPSTAAPWASQVEAWLRDDHDLPGIQIVRRLREEHEYRGGKSAVYELVRRLRPTAVAPLVRFEGVPGEFSQHDFGQVDVRYHDGRVERVRFFASRLKWSRVVHVVLVPDEREETLIRALLAALEAFGGVPLVTVWDNPKTVVLTRKGELIVWNPVFGQVALDYRFAPELCWPRAGQQKGAVENLVGWVKGSFFKCRRFHDRTDLEAQLAQIVTKTGEVVRHRRARARGQTSILPAHRAAMLDAVRGVRARLYYQRQSLWELGPAAERWLTELVHRRPSQWRRDVEQCFALLQDYGPAALLDALAWGVRHHAIGAEYVTTQLARRAPAQAATS